MGESADLDQINTDGGIFIADIIIHVHVDKKWRTLERERSG